MNIKIWIEANGDILEELGTCVTDSPGRAVQMYEEDAEKWENKGYMAAINWCEIK